MKVPTTLRELQCFMGLMNYERRFLKDFAAKMLPLTNATKRGAEFRGLTPEEEKAFRLEQLRGDNTAAAHALCALVEQHPDLAAQIEGVLQASGIVPPSRPPSVAVSDVSSLEED